MEYNSKQVLVSFGGVEMQGYGEGSMVSIEWDSGLTTDKLSVDGVVSASKSNDNRATAEVTLMATSPSNAVLSGFMEARKQGTGSIGVAPFFLRDLITGEEIAAGEAWIQDRPSIEFGNEVGERSWSIRLANARYIHAGLSA